MEFEGLKLPAVDGVQLHTEDVVRRFVQSCQRRLFLQFGDIYFSDKVFSHSNFLRICSVYFWVKIGKIISCDRLGHK